MKKFFKSLVTLMLVCLMAVSFTSCGVPSDPAKAKANLEENKYVVVYLSDAITLTATELGFGLERGTLKASVTGTNGEEAISIYYCNDSATAKKIKEKLSENKGENVVVGKSGKVVWTGTKEAIKAAK